MIFIPTQYLKPGMILAKDINITANNFSLLTRGQKLTESFIKKMLQLNITGIYIENGITDDIEIKEPIDEKLKMRALKDMKCIFHQFNYSKGMIGDAYVRQILNLSKEMVDDILSKEETMINLIGLKNYDDYTYHHSLSVAILSVTIGIALGLTQAHLNQIAMSALLHDIGKMVIPIEIINKPSSLTPEEFDIIKMHPVLAIERLSQKSLVPATVISAIKTHHEKFDGTGYPDGLSGKKISLYGRILAVADVYDALTSNRPYRRQCFPGEAIEYMMGSSDVHFDYDILTAFFKCVTPFPPGMCVSLSNGETAIVLKSTPKNVLRPFVRLVNSDGSAGNEVDLFMDTSYANVTIVGMGYEDKKLNFDSMIVNHAQLPGRKN